MKLLRIRNGYLYNSDDPNGYHDYLAFYNKETKSYFLVQLTHLYVWDKKRYVQVKRGDILVQKFKEYETPSGVKKEIYEKDLKGNKIRIKQNDEIKKIYRNISMKQEKIIKDYIFSKKKT